MQKVGRVLIMRKYGTKVLIRPTYGLAIKLAEKRGWYKWTKYLSILFVIASIVTGYLWAKQTISPLGSGVNIALFVFTAAAAAIFFGKPSTILASNQDGVEVEQRELDRAVESKSEDKFFRTW